ncbi:hypothetical protein QFZ55_000120 [Streptomyces luteogriseus]|nr:hypothetical protein [Streptomyces luteogriseus]
MDGPPPENCHRRQLWPKAAAGATHKSDVLDEVTERRLTRNLRTVKALTDPTVLEPVIAGVTAGSKRRAQCRRSGACP